MCFLYWCSGVFSSDMYLGRMIYDREQLAKEGTKVATDWGVVGCMYTAEPVETPMAPITMLRNALGVEEGGSGVPLDREAYRRAVAFWRTHEIGRAHV